MKLENVKCMGSEGRRKDVGEVPAKDDLIAFVTFKVDHIKDFEIVKEEAKSKLVEEDPAIISA